MSMDAIEASKARSRLWSELKPLLRRTLGAEGAVDWLQHAADQERIYARRCEHNVIELKPAEWTP